MEEDVAQPINIFFHGAVISHLIPLSHFFFPSLFCGISRLLLSAAAAPHWRYCAVVCRVLGVAENSREFPCKARPFTSSGFGLCPHRNGGKWQKFTRSEASEPTKRLNVSVLLKFRCGCLQLCVTLKGSGTGKLAGPTGTLHVAVLSAGILGA